MSTRNLHRVKSETHNKNQIKAVKRSNKRRKLSPETRAAISASLKKTLSEKNTYVLQAKNLITKEERLFYSFSEAARSIGCSKQHISQVMHRPGYYSARGWIFKMYKYKLEFENGEMVVKGQNGDEREVL